MKPSVRRRQAVVSSVTSGGRRVDDGCFVLRRQLCPT
jgi:hypothetical protein